MTRPDTLPARLMAATAGHRWLIPLLVLLGLIAFLFEGIGIYLLMPLLQTLSGTAGAAAADGLVGAATRWTADLPQGQKVAALVGAIVGELPAGATAGLGARLLSGSYYGQTVQIWAALFTAATLAAVLVLIVGWIERVTLKRMGLAR